MSVDHAFGQLELYVFGQDWPKAIWSTGNSVDKGPTFVSSYLEIYFGLDTDRHHLKQNFQYFTFESEPWTILSGRWQHQIDVSADGKSRGVEQVDGTGIQIGWAGNF